MRTLVSRIDLRFPVHGADASTADRALEVFARWRTDPERVERDGIVDLADYAHLPVGPRALLVARSFHLGLEWSREAGHTRARVLVRERGGAQESEADLARWMAEALARGRHRAEALLAEPPLSDLRLGPEVEVQLWPGAEPLPASRLAGLLGEATGRPVHPVANGAGVAFRLGARA
ncbi:MAG: hypothetical protein D6729_11110 [Deltaproteobacteria bacterium]|nr:MAG: hypothetical protein D6729_11110 [Deltaproteobacteria bacterium]